MSLVLIQDAQALILTNDRPAMTISEARVE